MCKEVKQSFQSISQLKVGYRTNMDFFPKDVPFKRSPASPLCFLHCFCSMNPSAQLGEEPDPARLSMSVVTFYVNLKIMDATCIFFRGPRANWRFLNQNNQKREKMKC